MKLIVEGFQYRSPEAKALLKEVFPLEQDGVSSIDFVGYYYNSKLEDTVFFLPKVVVDERGYLFENEKYDPEQLIDLGIALENNIIADDDFDFIYGLSVWIYRAISEYRMEQELKPANQRDNITYNKDIPNVGISGERVYNTFLDIMLSLKRFNDENQDFFTYELRNIHSGYNKINWSKTINRHQPIMQDGVPIYLDVVNKKKQINYDEELFVIFFSILQYMNRKYGFPVNIAFGYELLSEEEFEEYRDGYGERRLEQIRYKYFSDKLVLLWQLCYDFFTKTSNVNSSNKLDDYLLVKDFNIVFEAMIDKLLRDDRDERINKMRLKEQTDGKRVDHIFAYDGLIHNNKEIYYIGDSKYYKLGNIPQGESVYKQYTYARNVIQANLDLFNSVDGKNYIPEKDYLVYIDEATEGYNITPNFFIRAQVVKNHEYDNSNLRFIKSERPNYHFKNRLFDRDTLLLQHYDINFLFVLALYGSSDSGAQAAFKKAAKEEFRMHVKDELENHYQFFSLQLKPEARDVIDDEDEEAVSTKDKMDRIVEQKYFHKILGKAFRPYSEKEFLFLSLDSNDEFFDDNARLLSELSQDFNIRTYRLSSDPLAPINEFYTSLQAGIGSGGAAGPRALRFSDFGQEYFLVAGYREDKKQLDWILNHKLYNVRYSETIKGARNGAIYKSFAPAASARFLVLYEIGNVSIKPRIFQLGGHRKRTAKWMEKTGYKNPSDSYLVYDLVNELTFEEFSLSDLLEYNRIAEMEERRQTGGNFNEGWEKELVGKPFFITGKEIGNIHQNTALKSK